MSPKSLLMITHSHLKLILYILTKVSIDDIQPCAFRILASRASKGKEKVYSMTLLPRLLINGE